MPSQSFADMRRRNALKIVSTVRGTPEVSRAEVARLTNLARATVSSIVDELIHVGVLIETGSKQSAKGRRPIGLTFNTESRFCAGISVEASCIEIVVCDLNGVPRSEFSVLRPKSLDAKQLCELIKTGLIEALRAADVSETLLGPVGLAVPGRLPSAGEAADLSVIHLDYRQVQSELEALLSRKITVDSNLNMFAIAQCSHGSEQANGAQTRLIVRAGQLVRSALIIDGKLHEGQDRRAGQMGHLRVAGLTNECACGGQGCINTVASTRAILDSCIRQGLPVADMDELSRRVAEGDAKCIEILKQATSCLGIGIAIAINLLAPDTVIVAGRNFIEHDFVQETLLATVKAETLKDNLDNCNLVLGTTFSKPEALGAALSAMATHDLLPAEKVFA